MESKIAAAAPTSAQDERAINKVLNAEAYSGDLMQGLENGSIRLDSLQTQDFPADLQALSPEARQQEIQRRLAKRQSLRDEIRRLSQQRDAYLATRPASTHDAAGTVALSDGPTAGSAGAPAASPAAFSTAAPSASFDRSSVGFDSVVAHSLRKAAAARGIR